jgi:hypothetical protein
MESDILFEVSTLLGFRVHVTRGYWEFVVTVKHPVMRERATEVQDALHTPDEVRKAGVILRYSPFIAPRSLDAGSVPSPNDSMIWGSLSRPIPRMRSKKGNGYGAGKNFP